ncbi:hypothetical protein F2841_08020 [Bacteroides fragilis]|nr:hypothetical protein F2841_08020 [Bacteroides fragilis]KAA4790120.1 hypothetical protein F3B21_12430 [Bacteroides fragilis]
MSRMGSRVRVPYAPQRKIKNKYLALIFNILVLFLCSYLCYTFKNSVHNVRPTISNPCDQSMRNIHVF